MVPEILPAADGGGGRADPKRTPCPCVRDHTPEPPYTEGHHVLPRAVQEELWGAVYYERLEYLCPTAHRATHAYMDAVAASRGRPRVPSHARRTALLGIRLIGLARGTAWGPATLALLEREAADGG